MSSKKLLTAVTMGAGWQTLQIGVQAWNLVEVILGPKWMILDMNPKNRQLRGGPGAFFDRKMNIFFKKYENPLLVYKCT